MESIPDSKARSKPVLSLSRTKQLNKFNKDVTGSSGVKFLIAGPLKPTNLRCDTAIPSVVSG